MSAVSKILPLLLALVAPISAAPVTYTFDPVHSQLVFFVEHLGFSHAIGRFSRWQGEFRFDPDDWSQSTIDVRIPVSSLDLGDAGWNKKILSGNWLDAENYPQMRFVGESMERIDAQTGKLSGRLSLHGETRSVTLDVRFNKLGVHPLTLKPTLGFTASASLKRSDFGLRESLNSVGDEITVRIEVEGQRKRSDNPRSGKR